MRHEQYSFVEVAVGGAMNRGKVGDIRHMADLTGHLDCYKTVYRYPAEFVQHFHGQGRSVRGYNGEAFADWLPLDIDSDNLDTSLDYLRRIIDRLEIIGAEVNACKFFFSGAKGFHVLIPSAIFGASPSRDIHKRFRAVAEYIGGSMIDTKVYDKTRLFRIPNTVNSKTGLYKVEFYPHELLTMTMKEIIDTARSPRFDVDVETDFDGNEELAEIYAKTVEPKRNKPTLTGKGLPNRFTCMAKMMRQGSPEGSRNVSALRLMAHLKQSGLSENMIFVSMHEWNDKSSAPMDYDEIVTIFTNGMSAEYDFGCRDEIKKMYCSNECVWYKPEYDYEPTRGVL